MARLSLWKQNKSNDYRFFDRIIKEQFEVGGTDFLLHKYLGPTPNGVQVQTTTDTPINSNVIIFPTLQGIDVGDYVYANVGIPSNTTVVSYNTANNSITLSNFTQTDIPANTTFGFSNDPSKPSYTNLSPTNIQDLLFLENRDRVYDSSVYVLRGVYQRQDVDFDLSQFGLFLNNGTITVTFHYNTMIEFLGRKIINGDVVELLHLKDFDPLNDNLAPLKRFFVASDASWASEGFSPTWYPHLWRVRFDPLIDSQEFKGLLNNLSVTENTGLPGTPNAQTTSPLLDIMSTYNTYMGITEAVINKANTDVPTSGFDDTPYYVPLTDVNGNVDIGMNTNIYSPTPNLEPVGYLTGDGVPPDGYAVSAGISFPSNPNEGDYFLRLDFLPNRLFRFSGSNWQKVDDNVRTNLTPGASNNLTQKNLIVNNTNTVNVQTQNGNVTIPSSQTLPNILKPKADY